MNYLNYYFGHHHDKKVVYFVGRDAKVDAFKDVLSTSSFIDLVLIYEDSLSGNMFKDGLINLDLDKLNVHSLSSKELFIEKNKYHDYTFAFDHFINTDILANVIPLSPKKIVGLFNKDFDTFALWEQAKNFVLEMSLAREIDENRNEVLEYKYDENIPYELSIILPVYNVSKYLKQCFDSLRKWEAPFIEFVFVDDGSTDDSAEIIEGFKKIDKRVKLLRKENGGCASAREYGIEHSTGRYIGFVDPDDFIDPTMFKKLLGRAMNGSYDIAYSGYYEYYENSDKYQKIEDLTGLPYSLGTSDTHLIDQLIAYRKIAIWRGIYRREFLNINNIHFHTELRMFDDLPFKVETLAKAKSVVSIDEHLYYYRMGREGQDVSANDERIFIHFDMFKILDEFFKTNTRPGQLNYYKQVKAQTHFWALSVISPRLFEEYRQKASDDMGFKNSRNRWKSLIRQYYNDVDKKNLFFSRLALSTFPYVTLIVPFYNLEKDIKDKLDELFKVDLANLRYLFIDDGSSDKSFDIVKEYIKDNKRCNIIKLNHHGFRNARNVGLRSTFTKYIWFINLEEEIKQIDVNLIIDKAASSNDDVIYLDKSIKNITVEEIANDKNYFNKAYRTTYLKDNKIEFID